MVVSGLFRFSRQCAASLSLLSFLSLYLSRRKEGRKEEQQWKNKGRRCEEEEEEEEKEQSCLTSEGSDGLINSTSI